MEARLDTTTKIQARILKTAERTNTLREAVLLAAWEAKQEAEGLGWEQRTIEAMLAHIVDTAAEMVATTVKSRVAA